MARKNKAIILQKIRDIGFNMLISHIKFGKHNFKNKVSFLRGNYPKGFCKVLGVVVVGWVCLCGGTGVNGGLLYRNC